MASDDCKVNARFMAALCEYRDQTAGDVQFPLMRESRDHPTAVALKASRARCHR
ncbi:hypothetical protein AAVH_13017, partial [Aphelenchoides avenae]